MKFSQLYSSLVPTLHEGHPSWGMKSSSTPVNSFTCEGGYPTCMIYKFCCSSLNLFQQAPHVVKSSGKGVISSSTGIWQGTKDKGGHPLVCVTNCGPYFSSILQVSSVLAQRPQWLLWVARCLFHDLTHNRQLGTAGCGLRACESCFQESRQQFQLLMARKSISCTGSAGAAFGNHGWSRGSRSISGCC